VGVSALVADQVEAPKASKTTTASLLWLPMVHTTSSIGPVSADLGGLTPRILQRVGATHRISKSSAILISLRYLTA
jgi:hypothetical protein